MIDSLWVDAWHLLGGAVCSNENIVYDAGVLEILIDIGSEMVAILPSV